MIVTKGVYIDINGIIDYEVLDNISEDDFDPRNGRLIAFKKDGHNVYYDNCVSGFAYNYKHFVHIDEFIVKETHRGKGIGHEMITRFMKIFENEPIVLFASALPKCYPEFNYENKTLDELSNKEWDVWCQYQDKLIEFYKNCGFEDITEVIGEQSYAEQRIMARTSFKRRK